MTTHRACGREQMCGRRGDCSSRRSRDELLVSEHYRMTCFDNVSYFTLAGARKLVERVEEGEEQRCSFRRGGCCSQTSERYLRAEGADQIRLREGAYAPVGWVMTLLLIVISVDV